MFDPNENRNPQEEEKYLGVTTTVLNAGFAVLVGGGVLIVCAWLFALGGMDTVKDMLSPGPDYTFSHLADIERTPQQAADAAVMTLTDLPPGWTVAPPEEDDDVDFQYSEQCAALAQETFGGEIATASSDELEGPVQQSLESDASVFNNADEAESVLNQYRSMLSSCQSDLMAAFKAGFDHGVAKEGANPADFQVQINWEDQPSPKDVESGLAFRIFGSVTGPGSTFAFAVDFVAFRQGRMVGGLVYTQLGVQLAEEHKNIVRTAADKLGRVNDSIVESSGG